jgi:hypothetical protein
MTPRHRSTDVYLEVGTKRTFAGAIEWPGWSRSGRDEDSALSALVDYAPRYAAVVRGSGLAFSAGGDVTALRIIERLRGDATTDFGVPGKHPTSDQAPMIERDLARSRAVLRASWDAFDRTITLARGRTLRKGPRGGGRGLDQIVDHVLQAEAGYLSQLGGSAALAGAGGREALRRVREAVLATLEAAAHGQVPKRGPRGGRRWPPRYFTRRAAWHVLDHVWEIEDRLSAAGEE